MIYDSPRSTPQLAPDPSPLSLNTKHPTPNTAEGLTKLFTTNIITNFPPQ